MKVSETVVEFVTVAVPTVGAPAGPLVEPCAPRIGMVVSYLINQQLTIEKESSLALAALCILP